MPGQIPLYGQPATGSGAQWQLAPGSSGKLDAGKVDLYITEDGYFNSFGSNLPSDSLPPYDGKSKVFTIPGYGL